MVYPVSSQQIPASNTFQPGAGVDVQVRKGEENKQADTTKPSGSETARTQSSETRNNGSRAYQTTSNDREVDTGAVAASSSRGQNLNITV